MNIIHAIGLKDVGPFRDVTFKIPKGVSVIYGLNKAGGKFSANSNGVGKSMLMSSLAEMIYEDPIVGEKADRIVSGKRAFSFTDTNGKKITAVRQAKGRTDRLSIKVDGVEKKFRTPTYARAFLKKSFPLSQEEFSTYVHIDSRIPHPLVMGTSAARKAFFTSFFGLDRMDAERKLFIAELNKLQRVKSAFNALRDTYENGKADLLNDEQLANAEKTRRIVKRKLESLQHNFEEAQDTLRLLQFAQSAKDQIKTLTIACGGTINEGYYEKAVADNKWELNKVRADIEETERWEQYKRDNARYTEAFAALSSEARLLIKTEGSRGARSMAEAAASELVRATAAVKHVDLEVKRLKTELEESLPERVEAPSENEGDLQTLSRAYAHQLEHAEQFQEGKCETCGQVVDIKDPTILKKKLKSVRAKLEAHADARLYKEARKNRNNLQFKLKAYVTDLSRAKAKAEKHRELADLHDELSSLPRRPKPFEGKKLQLVVLKRMFEELQERKSLLDYVKPHLQTIIEFKALTKADVVAARAASSVSGEMNELQDRLSKAQARIELHKTISERQAEIRTKLVEMKKELADEQPLKLLVQGYQDKNIKKMAVEAISERLMALINRYAKLVFPEDFTFSFEWGTQIRLLVHRKYGRKISTSDVRKLSGAESKLFTIVLVLSLLSFVPSHKRTNLLVLDEPSANLSKEMTQSLQELIPVLNKFIPSIVIITPRSDERFNDAHNFTVVKMAGVATIVDGHPHDLK